MPLGEDRHETKPIVIDIQRWDPVTAISSASLSTVSGLADATAGIIRDPYIEYKRHHRTVRSQESNSTPTSISESAIITPETSNTTTRSVSSDPEETNNYAKQMALASANSFAKFLGRSSKGALVDLPLAVAEGMRSVPRLYGENIRDHNKVTDWRSGASVAWSSFSHGLYEGVTDIFIHTYHGKKEQGAIGVAKGLTRGLISLTMKTGAGTAGLVAYPNQGIYRSLRAAVKKGSATKIDQARWAEAERIMMSEEGMRIDTQEICQQFDVILASRGK